METTLFNSSLLRYGINKNSEIRLQVDYAKVKKDGIAFTGFNPIIIGTKLDISEGKSIIPKTSFLLNLTLPFLGNENFRPHYLMPSFYLLMQNNINSKSSIGYNLGIEYDETKTAPAKFISLCFTHNIAYKLSGFIESYNWFSDNMEPENFIDCGLAYFLRKNFQIDLSGNINVRSIKNYFLFSFGVSWSIQQR